MTKQRVLITVKTYPTLSKKYTELVCTAGFKEDGSWIRIYPSPFRFLEDTKRYKKYQWIELDINKNPKDKRPESYRPCNIDNINLGNEIGTGSNWAERKKLILEKNIIHTNLKNIIEAAHNNEYSLVIFKPAEILDFVIEKSSEDWELNKKEAAQEALKQGSLFDDISNRKDFKLVPKLPYKFSYKFKDDSGKESKLMIEDWEIGQLYWNCFKKYRDKNIAVIKVKEKYLNDFAYTKDIHLFLGTTYKQHFKKSKNPYVIIGVFAPPYIKQLELF